MILNWIMFFAVYTLLIGHTIILMKDTPHKGFHEILINVLYLGVGILSYRIVTKLKIEL